MTVLTHSKRMFTITGPTDHGIYIFSRFGYGITQQEYTVVVMLPEHMATRVLSVRR